MPKTEVRIIIGYSILSILLIFIYWLDAIKTKKQNNKVVAFIKIEKLSIIKLLLKIFTTASSWFKTKANIKTKLKIANKLTSLKLFLINTPSINKNIIAPDINSSGNIYKIVSIYLIWFPKWYFKSIW